MRRMAALALGLCLLLTGCKKDAKAPRQAAVFVNAAVEEAAVA